MKKIVLASNNKHKIKEFNEILNDYEILSLRDIGYFEDIVEDGKSFFENSMIKAQAVMNFLRGKGELCPVIADDSGLCVNALGGAPGIYSARYSGDHDDSANRKKLIEDLKQKEDKFAYFNCTLVVLYPDGEYKTVEGKVYGEIIDEERGDTSFGYDCLFMSDDLGKTFGEATNEEKNSVSHRGRALQKLKEIL